MLRILIWNESTIRLCKNANIDFDLPAVFFPKNKLSYKKDLKSSTHFNMLS